MKRNPAATEDPRQRATIDGRVAFAIAGFAALAGLLALLDRIGAPEPLIRALGPLAVLAALATIGALLRVMTPPRFYAARAVPTPYAGFATVAFGLGLALPFAPPAANGDVGGGVAWGAAAGLAVGLLVLNPALRRTGALSIGGLLAARFPYPLFRLALGVILAAIGALIGLAGVQAAIAALSDVLGLGRPAVTALLAFTLVLVAAPGGLFGLLWAANGAGGVLLAALGLPVAFLMLHGDMPTPILEQSPVWGEAAGRIAQWGGEAGLSGWAATLGAACGVAGLTPLLAGWGAARNGAAAFRAGIFTLGWAGVAAALAAIALLWGVLALGQAVGGREPDRLPEAVYAGGAVGILDLCGAPAPNPAAARRNCAERSKTGPLGPADARPRGPFFPMALTGLAGAGTAGTSLLAAGLVAVELCLAAIGFFLCATTLGRDLLGRNGGRGAQTSRRLATTRALMVGVAAIGVAWGGARTFDPRLLIGLAFMLAAAVILPLLVLCFAQRVTGRDALAALFGGVAGAEIVLFAGGPTPDVMARAALVGTLAGIAAGIAASYVGAGDRAGGDRFLQAVRHGRDDAFAPDGGA